MIRVVGARPAAERRSVVRPMHQRIRRVLRIVFVIVSALASLLWVTTLILFTVLRPPGDQLQPGQLCSM